MGPQGRGARHSPRRLALLAEAALALVIAKLALRAFPFRHLVRVFSLRPSRPELEGVARAQVREEVSWAISAAARRLPVSFACFPRAIAAQAMMRRRGVGATLYYGAARVPSQGLTTHVWVQDGAVGVVGHLEASHFRMLACYPEPDPEAVR